jgi:hypothetical protein
MEFVETVDRRLTVLLIWLSLAFGAAYLSIFEPGKSGYFPVCPFRALTGFTCPGCGSTRGLHRLLHGDVIAAFELNPLVMLSLPFLFYALVRYTKAVLQGRPLQTSALDPRYIWILLGIVLFFWVFRNTPFYPFVS